jgi:hypothetical protein
MESSKTAFSGWSGDSLPRYHSSATPGIIPAIAFDHAYHHWKTGPQQVLYLNRIDDHASPSPCLLKRNHEQHHRSVQALSLAGFIQRLIRSET